MRILVPLKIKFTFDDKIKEKLDFFVEVF